MPPRLTLISRVLEWWPELKWRHHGTGMLQAYAPDWWPDSEGVRVHVWHPDLLLPGMAASGGMHNHRFGLQSTVLLGSILHSHLLVTPDRDGRYIAWRINFGSRSADKDLAPYQQMRVGAHPTRRLDAGATYKVEKWAYHHARPFKDIAVTYVDLADKEHDATASLLARCGTVPVAAFSHDLDTDLIKNTLDYARGALERINVQE